MTYKRKQDLFSLAMNISEQIECFNVSEDEIVDLLSDIDFIFKLDNGLNPEGCLSIHKD